MLLPPIPTHPYPTFISYRGRWGKVWQTVYNLQQQPVQCSPHVDSFYRSALCLYHTSYRIQDPSDALNWILAFLLTCSSHQDSISTWFNTEIFFWFIQNFINRIHLVFLNCRFSISVSSMNHECNHLISKSSFILFRFDVWIFIKLYLSSPSLTHAVHHIIPSIALHCNTLTEL